MAKKIINTPSRTLSEYRLLTGETTEDNSIDNIHLRTPLVHNPEEKKKYYLNIPMVSAAMQSVSGEEMAIELAKLGGLAFIYCSQTVEEQSKMIKTVKQHKAGFVEPETVSPDTPVKQLYEMRQSRGYSTFPVVDENNSLLGLITKNDYSIDKHRHLKVKDRMILRENIDAGVNISDLKVANDLLIESHRGVLPIIDENNKLKHLVFRKDIRDHLDNPLQIVDERKRLLCGAAINTKDYQERVSELIKNDVDVLLIDSSDGYSVYQKQALEWLNKNYPEVPVVGGNIITGEGFRYLVEAGACAVKIGMGGGSICITQEQKGTGRGLATAIIDVVEERQRYFDQTGKYIPVIADGGIVHSKDITIALALGCDYVMMGRYFARFDESPTEKITIGNRILKPYWGEGSRKARYWRKQRYSQTAFIEGVEGYVDYVGKMRDNLPETLTKIKSSMSSAGCCCIKELHENAVLELISSLSIREGKVHDIYRHSDFEHDYID